ncbi:alpha/beta hydrolase [Zhouia sp. PK063]|uniref:alpha/beta hydrolase n=1 Tax=Zhouia sp. PK063 TaxID=3373602 RepID=UPI0037925FF6
MLNKNLSLQHLIKPAETTQEKPNVLFMFHGYGSNEDDLFSFAPELPKELCIISVQAPYNIQGFGYAWYAINFDAEHGKWSDNEQAIQSRDAIVKFIDEACNAYQLNTENITLLGFSQGAILSYAVALTYPAKIKNIISLSGYINEDIFKIKATEAYQKLHFYCSHGSVDQVIPVEWARQTSPFLEKLAIDFVYEEYPVGHGVAPQNFYSFKNWLDKHL